MCVHMEEAKKPYENNLVGFKYNKPTLFKYVISFAECRWSPSTMFSKNIKATTNLKKAALLNNSYHYKQILLSTFKEKFLYLLRSWVM